MRRQTVTKMYGLDKTVPFMINDISVGAEPDGAAGINVMDGFQFRRHS